jgi:hypothetical protein
MSAQLSLFMQLATVLGNTKASDKKTLEVEQQAMRALWATGEEKLTLRNDALDRGFSPLFWTQLAMAADDVDAMEDWPTQHPIDWSSRTDIGSSPFYTILSTDNAKWLDVALRCGLTPASLAPTIGAMTGINRNKSVNHYRPSVLEACFGLFLHHPRPHCQQRIVQEVLPPALVAQAVLHAGWHGKSGGVIDNTAMAVLVDQLDVHQSARPLLWTDRSSLSEGVDEQARPDFVRAWIETAVRFEQAGHVARWRHDSKTDAAQSFVHPVKTLLMDLPASAISKVVGKRGAWTWALERNRLAMTQPLLVDDLLDQWDETLAAQGEWVHPGAHADMLLQRLAHLEAWQRGNPKTRPTSLPTFAIFQLEGTGHTRLESMDWTRWMDTLQTAGELGVAGPRFDKLFLGPEWDSVLDPDALAHWTGVRDLLVTAHAEALELVTTQLKRGQRMEVFNTAGAEKLALSIALLPQPGNAAPPPKRSMRL